MQANVIEIINKSNRLLEELGSLWGWEHEGSLSKSQKSQLGGPFEKCVKYSIKGSLTNFTL